MKIGRKGAARTCVVLSKGWPSWAFGAAGSGLQVKYVLLFNGEWEQVVASLLPGATVINCESAAGRCGVRSVELDRVDYCFSDMDPPGRASVWGMTRNRVITSRRCRRAPKEWKEESLTVSHSASGGVTDLSLHVYVYTLRMAPETEPIVVSASGKRDLSAILDARARNGVPCPPPIRCESMPMVGKLQGRSDTYRGDGWLPWGQRSIFVVTPNEFSASKWCRRKLSSEEWLQVLDMPVGIIKALSSSDKARVAGDLEVIPVKILAAICQELNTGELVAAEASAVDTQEVARAAGPIEGESVGKLVAEADREKDRTAKATKSDDAAVPEFLWDDRLLGKFNLVKTDEMLATLAVLRSFFCRIWKRNVTLSFIRWWKHKRKDGQGSVEASRLVVCSSAGRQYRWRAKGKKQYKAMRNSRKACDRDIASDAVDAIRRSANSTWWEWTHGSFPFFWRWPEWFQETIRLGEKPCLSSKVPRCLVPQKSEKDEFIWAASKKKIQGPLGKGYLERGEVHSLTSFFAVKKGEDDIRMVYDRTRSGLNDAMFAPWFPLPTVEQLIRVVEVGSYMGDIDVGEMFLNFVMHKDLRVHCGVDLTLYFPELIKKDDGTLWVRWSRCGMGFKNSPYGSTRGMAVAEEVMQGENTDEKNIFRWDVVELNLPGMATYNPARAWVAKVRLSDGMVACDVFIYVDDVRTVGPSEPECWQASRHVASMTNWLGLQDAARKRRPPSQEPGAWAGSIVFSSGDQVVVMISEERWVKTKSIIRWIREEHEANGSVEFKLLEAHRGFLIYISRTYPSVCPYLKGIHQTLDSWRPWRRDDGWKMSLVEMRVALAEEGKNDFGTAGFSQSDKVPPRVVSAPRLGWDLEALEKLFEGDVPVRQKVRPSQTAVAVYGFGDASGKGFGSSFVVADKLIYRHGQWAVSVENESSNYRELSNLVLAVEEATDAGHLADCELFLFTDNTTAERCYYRGTSQSRKLFELVLRLRKLQLGGDVSIHVIHVAGTRMIEEGTDGLSRGNINEGVMSGTDILSFIPLHLNAAERQDGLVQWIRAWAESELSESYQVLTAADWFTTGQTRNHCIWMPPPAAADVAVEMLGKSKHKRPKSEHIFVCPRLMTNRWRKQLTKVCDVVLTIPLGTNCWGVREHEPLLVGLALPLISHRPWRLRGVPLLERVVGQLSSLSSTSPDWGRDILQQLLGTTRKLEGMPEGVVWEVLHSA